jgi:hypothetical protein
MSVDLLQKLEAMPRGVDPAEIEKQGSVLDQMRIAHVHDVAAAVVALKGSEAHFKEIWRQLVLVVAQGRIVEAHAVRPHLLASIDKCLNWLKRIRARAVDLQAMGGREATPDPEELLPDIVGLERLKADLFDRWQSPEDLELLAVNHYPLSKSHLEDIATSHPPAPEWYTEEEERLY